MNKTENNLTKLEEKIGELPKLQEMDIVLIRTQGGFFAFLLRFLTKSYWDKIALILYPEDDKKGIDSNIIIEAEKQRIVIHKLDKYLENTDKYLIGIKRMKFMSKEELTRAKSFLLMNIDTPHYSLNLTELLVSLIFSKVKRKFLSNSRFSAAGLIQKAFYEAAEWDMREIRVFQDDYISPIELQETTTPSDVSKSEVCEWVYNKHD